MCGTNIRIAYQLHGVILAKLFERLCKQPRAPGACKRCALCAYYEIFPAANLRDVGVRSFTSKFDEDLLRERLGGLYIMPEQEHQRTSPVYIQVTYMSASKRRFSTQFHWYANI
uniref:Uncharacterized protein n=1 Tax=Trichogramma kaykai TaxID=54128 RepID=A0ABD2WLK6_9HYME